MPINLGDTIRESRQNLLEQVPQEKAVKPEGFYKAIILDVLTVLSAAYFGYSAKNFFGNGSAIELAIGAFPLFIFSSFETLLIKNFWRRALIIFLEAVAMTSFFYQEDKIYLAGAIACFFLLSAWGEKASRSKTANSLEIKFLKSVSPLLKKTATALALFIIILYLPTWNGDNALISKDTFDGVFTWSSGLTHNFFPEINFSSNIGDMAAEIAKYQLAGTHPYEDLPEAAKKTISTQIVIQVKEQIKKFLGGPALSSGGQVSDNEKLSDIFYKITVGYLAKWKAQFGNWFIASWAAAVFLTARSLAGFVWWISAFISVLVYQIMIATNFIAVRGETIMKESLMFT